MQQCAVFNDTAQTDMAEKSKQLGAIADIRVTSKLAVKTLSFLLRYGDMTSTGNITDAIKQTFDS